MTLSGPLTDRSTELDPTTVVSTIKSLSLDWKRLLSSGDEVLSSGDEVMGFETQTKVLLLLL